jgi:hypothetical protein
VIVVDEGERLRLVTQPDHAHFAGELVALWRADGLPGHRRREDLLFAVREHDNGWREPDAAPSWNAGAERPHDFLSVPDAVKVEVWRRGVDRFAAQRPYAALLVALHALALFSGRRGEAPWDPLLDDLAARRDELLEAAGASIEEARADYRFLELADTASLGVCSRDGRTFERAWPDGGRRGCFEAATETLYLDAFPLAGATTFRVPARWIPKRIHAGDADLGGALAEARWGELTVRVSPPGLPG